MKRTTKRLLAIALCLLLLPLDGMASAVQDQMIAPPRYMRELSRLVASTKKEDSFGTIELTLGETEMTVDGVTQPITEDETLAPYVDADGEVRIPAAVLDETDEVGAYLSASELEDDGYAVRTDEATGEIVLTEPYGLCRLFVKTENGKVKNTHGATQSVRISGGRTVLQYENKADTAAAAALFRKDADVLWCAPDQIFTADAVDDADDGPVSWGTGFVGAHEFMQTLPDASQLPQVVVAVLDTGVDLDHPFLKDRLLDGWDFVHDDDDPDDDHMHGTHCAGIVRDATPDNVKILPIKAGDENGHFMYGNVVSGIEYACARGADVISMSFGANLRPVGVSMDEDEAKESANTIFGESVAVAVENDVVLFAAAGNDGLDGACVIPAALDDVIAVSSIDESGRRSAFSNYGDVIDVAAPGENILSSVPGGEYEAYSGTSMACPLAAACGALLLCEDETRTREEVRETLRSRARDFGAPGDDPDFGSGVVYPGIAPETAGMRCALPEIIMHPYKSAYLSVCFEPYNAKCIAVTYESSDPSVVSVNDAGLLSAKTTGTAQITVRSFAGGFTDTCTVTVRGGTQFRKLCGVWRQEELNTASSALIVLRNDGTAQSVGFSSTKACGYANGSSLLGWFSFLSDQNNVITGIRDIWSNGDATYFTDATSVLYAVGKLDGLDSAEPRVIRKPDGTPLTDVKQCEGPYALCADGSVWYIGSAAARQVIMEDETPLTNIRAVHKYTAIAESGETYFLSYLQMEDGSKTDPYYASPLIAEGIDPADVADCIAVVPYAINADKTRTAFWLLRDGTLWGIGGKNWLGDPRQTGVAETPVQIVKQLRNPLTGVKQIRSNYYYYEEYDGGAKHAMYALCDDGTVWAWGIPQDSHLTNGPLGANEKPTKEYGYAVQVCTQKNEKLTGVVYLPEPAGRRVTFVTEDGTVYWAGDLNTRANTSYYGQPLFVRGVYAAPAEVQGHPIVLSPDAPDVDPELVTPVESVTVSASSAVMRKGETLTLTAQAFPENAENSTIFWSSSAPWIASVTPDGTVTAHAPGKATITAKASLKADPPSATCTVTVLPPQNEVVAGDTDGDGKLTLKDVTMLMRYLAGGWNAVVDRAAADFNGDGSVDLRDVALLRRFLAGWGEP